MGNIKVNGTARVSIAPPMVGGGWRLEQCHAFAEALIDVAHTMDPVCKLLTQVCVSYADPCHGGIVEFLVPHNWTDERLSLAGSRIAHDVYERLETTVAAERTRRREAGLDGAVVKAEWIQKTIAPSVGSVQP